MPSIPSLPNQKRKNRRGDDARDEEFYNRREYNEWVDDAYLLLAKAQFYLKNLPAARSAFSYTVSIATDPDLISEANIWMARIQTEEGNYSEASRILQGFTDIDGLPKSIASRCSTLPWLMSLSGRNAIMMLSVPLPAVETSTNKHFKVRLTYLLAQVCKATGDNSLSTRYFRDVIQYESAL